MYKLQRGIDITRLSDGASIPVDPLNRDYRDYLEWLAAGNKPQDADADPLLPAKIDLGADVPTDQGDKLADAVATLRTYLNVSSPTAAQSAAALKLLIRVVLFVLKYRLGL